MAQITTTTNENIIIDAYIEAASFTEDNTGTLTAEFIRESSIDCMSFYRQVAPYVKDGELAQLGHDFWLTRNGHGAGFWDGDWPIYGDMFTKISEWMGEVYPEFEDSQ